MPETTPARRGRRRTNWIPDRDVPRWLDRLRLEVAVWCETHRRRQRELAELAGIGANTLSTLLSGHAPRTPMAQVDALRAAMGLSWSAFD